MVPVVHMPIGLGQPVVNVELISVSMLSHWLSAETPMATDEMRSNEAPMNWDFRHEAISLLLLILLSKSHFFQPVVPPIGDG